MSSNSVKSIFCLLNCFDNYSIVGSKIVQFYIANAAKKLAGQSVSMKTFFEDTPFIVYSLYLLPGEKPPLPQGIQRSKQCTDFVTILALTAVTLARINSADATVFGMQGVVPNPGFATMYAIANEMNKVTAYWTDDLRNLWGTSDNPLMIGMAPLPYKYLWASKQNPNQPSQYNVQPKGLNGPLVTPNIGSSKDLCPVIDEEKFAGKWNSFLDLLQRGISIRGQNKAGISQRTQNLIKLGNAIIQYVEHSKTNKYPNIPTGWNPMTNYTLYLDMEYVIGQNLNLLYTQEQGFFKVNVIDQPVADMHTVPAKKITPSHLNDLRFSQAHHAVRKHPFLDMSPAARTQSHTQTIVASMAQGMKDMAK